MIQFQSQIDWTYAAPSKPWVKFFSKLPEMITLPLNSWKEIHYLSYFVCKYQDFYGRKYSFSFIGSPSKCQEIILIKKIVAALGGMNAEAYIKYIDWVFAKKIKTTNTQIRSLSYFLASGFINEFLGCLSRTTNKIHTISRSTKLPANYVELAKQYELTLETYGDMAFLKQYVDQNKDSLNEYAVTFFQVLVEQGFNLELLNSIV